VEFHLGDDTRWAAPAYDNSQWEHIKANDSWGSQTHHCYTGLAWYRRHLEITPSFTGNRKLAILMPNVDDAYEVYGIGARPPGVPWV
jgi:hypothetical protein